MPTTKIKMGRRSFIKNAGMGSGALILGFSFLNACKPNGSKENSIDSAPKEWFKINGYLKIADNGVVTIMSPNPEAGQNVKTSMPMVIADELDVAWENVVVEQAPLNTDAFSFQFIGGSQAIRRGWPGLRKAGATARHMLKMAAAKQWNVGIDTIKTKDGRLIHESSGKSAGYGEFANAASGLEIPEEVLLKNPDEFHIIGNSKKNVEGINIVTGKPLFGIDTIKEGMLIAMVVHPPAFGQEIKSVNDAEAKIMPGIKDIFTIKLYNDDYVKTHFDTRSFNEVAVIVGERTWQVMQAKKVLEVDYVNSKESITKRKHYSGRNFEERIPSGMESSSEHYKAMERHAKQNAETVRRDGNPEKAFLQAKRIVERTYTAPFLTHNCMEPMNFFADVRNGKARLSGPVQKPEFTEQTLSARTGIPLENIEIEMTRLGGGYGRRSYSHWAIEAALISQKMNAPIKLVYSREDDMTAGIYRSMYHVTYKAAIDAENNLTAIQVNAGGVPESPLYANRFPAGAVSNYLAESWTIDSNITIGSFRAPRSNFAAFAEQAFLDEVAETLGKDPIDFRLELLERAKSNPVGENNDYDPNRYAEVLKQVREKSGWDTISERSGKGVSAYFCHNSYAAQVLELKMEAGLPSISKVTCVLDCGIVINPDSARNMAEGGIVDGIGNALFGEMPIENGVPQKSNFDTYRMIRMKEVPKAIEVHFITNGENPTGLGEPTFPPIFAALGNAMYKATGRRYYHQPFITDKPPLVG
ncbi:molybdopterin cofactor-binding domain-containing protein [Cytophaga sp. FL35]|uniref:xanthine dehydrogenase family protein molybdopterin-binding subunit n=1 Tax=Cytophaga sp. FL35 TaxID=1904456 RepID=UPI001653802E|nr:molybdopterin cofactor-binding domain-containing protein [Cytophaga sp. FL35]MBC6999793.1 xanthine dehydrogenase family protein molybdopterin-binding subunit [Cytophaga sp. FL35]